MPDDFRFPAQSRLYSIPLDAARPEVWKPFALAEKDPFSGTNFAAIGRLPSFLRCLRPHPWSTKGPKP
ncbi:MAG TPA: hypothetical protein VFB92_01210 [Vicinamibacterales bacterium]|nr:hypothetical protein [Vicinamibacterales bacterium]